MQEFFQENLNTPKETEKRMKNKIGKQEKETKLQRVCAAILKKYKVTEKEYTAILEKIDSFLHEIRAALQKEKVEAYVMLGGSAAKGTFLKHDFDCDIFVRFVYDQYKEKDISNILENALKKVPKLDYERVHGSRDYFQGKWKDLHWECIPVLYIQNKDMAKNITDVSPLHVEWLNQHLSEKLRDEILLTKLFFKAQKVYGAESYMNGFSGHIVDLLTVYYGSFRELLENIETWGEKQVINMTSHPVNINALNPDKLQSAIIVIDPIQPERNAAAAVSYEQFYQIKNQAALFLENPSLEFFKRKTIGTKELKEMKKEAEKTKSVFMAIQAAPTHGKIDTIGTKIVKALEHIETELRINDFTVEKTGWDWEEVQEKPMLVWLKIKEKELPKTKEHVGPPLKLKNDVEAFRKKHKKVYFKEEKIYAIIQRKYTTPEKLVKDALKKKDIKEKAQKWQIIC